MTDRGVRNPVDSERAERARQVRQMFGRIAFRYDLVNRLMSLGMDTRWRRLAARAAAPGGALALDVGTGTGDLALELQRDGTRLVVGVDFASRMLSAAVRKAGNAAGLTWAQADALSLPFPDATFDCVTNAFLLRNLVDLPAGLREMARVLRPGGHLICLDMTHPRPGVFGSLYRFYFNRLLPRWNAAISGDRAAYRYLPNSLAGFPDADGLCRLLEQAGLERVMVTRLARGSVALHSARKPGAPPDDARS